MKAAQPRVLAHQFLQPRLVDGHAPSLQQFDLLRVLVHADDLVARFGEAGAGHQSHVARADDGQVHAI